MNNKLHRMSIVVAGAALIGLVAVPAQAETVEPHQNGAGLSYRFGVMAVRQPAGHCTAGPGKTYSMPSSERKRAASFSGSGV